MRYTTRNLFAIIALVAIICLLLTSVQGPILTDGIAFFAPIILGAFLTWKYYSRQSTSSLLSSFTTGAIGGLVGNLLWPTGLLLAIVLLGETKNIPSPGAMLLASVALSLAIGGAISATLTVGFPVHQQSLQRKMDPDERVAR